MRTAYVVRTVGALALAASVPSAAWAQPDQENAAAETATLQIPAFRPPELASLGEEAIRFWKRPARGGRGYMVELVPQPEGPALANVVVLFVHPFQGISRIGGWSFELPRGEYGLIAELVDAGIVEGEPSRFGPDGQVYVCGDGPGNLTERRKGGLDRHLAGFPCGDQRHPNGLIALAIEGLMWRSDQGLYSGLRR